MLHKHTKRTTPLTNPLVTWLWSIRYSVSETQSFLPSKSLVLWFCLFTLCWVWFSLCKGNTYTGALCLYRAHCLVTNHNVKLNLNCIVASGGFRLWSFYLTGCYKVLTREENVGLFKSTVFHSIYIHSWQPWSWTWQIGLDVLGQNQRFITWKPPNGSHTLIFSLRLKGRESAFLLSWG